MNELAAKQTQRLSREERLEERLESIRHERDIALSERDQAVAARNNALEALRLTNERVSDLCQAINGEHRGCSCCDY
jgi:hypothetical protein